MQILLTIVLFATSICCTAQNILFLKSGDKLNGKLTEVRNDSIVFNLRGNNLKFKTSDILSIYFDEKLAPQDLNSNPNKSTSNEVKITGVITYYFNENYGYKPDLGAQVYAIDTSKIPDINYKIIDTFINVKACLFLYSYLDKDKSLSQKMIDDIKAIHKRYSKRAFDSLDNRTYVNILKMGESPSILKTVVDGNGNYSIKLNPGVYYIYIKSNNRTGLSVTEVNGKILWKKVIVKAGEDTNVSNKFEVY